MRIIRSAFVNSCGYRVTFVYQINTLKTYKDIKKKKEEKKDILAHIIFKSVHLPFLQYTVLGPRTML